MRSQAFLPKTRRHSPGWFPIGSGALSGLAVVGFLLAFTLPAAAQFTVLSENSYYQAAGAGKARFLKQSTLAAGNGIYEVVVEDIIGLGVGLYSVRTDSAHPIGVRDNSQFRGQKVDLLVGGRKNLPGTSFTTIRSYSSQTDYTQTEFAHSEPPFKTVWLDTLFINENDIVTDYLEPILNADRVTTGFKITYSLPGLPRDDSTVVMADTLEIIEILNVHGTTFDDSWVEITTIVKNTGSQPVDLGIRYLWDLAVATDDGPRLADYLGKQFSITETRLGPAPPRFPFYIAAGNDAISGLQPPGYNVYGSVLTPGNLRRAPDQPKRAYQVSWPLAFFKTFGHQPDENLDVTTTADPRAGIVGGDNAILYFWGPSSTNALSVAPGDSVEVTQALLATLPNDPPALIDTRPPVYDVEEVVSEPPQSMKLTIRDNESGLKTVKIKSSRNAKLKIQRFDIGTNKKVHITGTQIDESEPFSFTLKARDMYGNTLVFDPIFLTLRPGLRVADYHVEPTGADRYLYVKNQGLDRIDFDLNGHEFSLSAGAISPQEKASTLAMPAFGDMTIDLVDYLNAEANRLSIAFEGPAGSQADLILADFSITGRVDVVLDLAPVPRHFALSQNAPNPFRQKTTIQFELPASGNQNQHVELRIYNLLGQRVRTLVHTNLPPGSHLAHWDGRSQNGDRVAAGVYLYSLEANGKRVTKKLTLIR